MSRACLAICCWQLAGVANAVSLGPLVKRAAWAAEAVDRANAASNGVGAGHCLLVVVGVNASSHGSLDAVLSSPEVRDYFGSFSACAFLDDALQHWMDGCDTLLQQLVDFAGWPACHVAATCRAADTSMNALHGLCLEQCENAEAGNGTVTTSCEEAAIVQAGLRHPRVCGDSLPAGALLEYMGSWDIVTLGGVAYLSATANLVTTAVAKELDDGPQIVDLFRTIYHFLILLYIMVYSCSVLANATHMCRFIVLATPFLYGPFVFSFSQLFQSLVLLLNANTTTAQRTKTMSDFVEAFVILVRTLVTGKAASKRADLRKRRPCVLRCIVLAILGPFLFVFVPFASVFVPMFAVSFWGLVAYIHITLIFGLYLCFLALGVRGVQMAEHRLLKWAGIREEREQKSLLADNLHMLLSLQALMPLTLLSVGGFLLYVTGEWRPLHDSFFHGLTVPPIRWPDFQLWWEPVEIVLALKRLITMDLSLSMADAFSLALLGQLVFTIVKVLQILVLKCCCPKKREDPRKAGDQQQTPEGYPIGEIAL